ncbi:hypothetical protein [Mucilaginibacter pocheonensis]|uniref:Glycosyltransferase involved in cell wall biosynthesis n=1 Tax=Mucilaginibacter pocheonensis TaxID=398050 RepID=A0ABU1T5C6_9SPHI|nr:hypothetical protein [Mucilaginibacter pocheonensis]MDR6940553.1 glycosyltransferase involved in cell wall biosynthesis [Mucilaginibacter pocheonensis]
MNILCIPYHDWRKIEDEGSRTRDSHVIQHLVSNTSVDNVIVLNRPITYSEIFFKRKRLKLTGEVIYQDKEAKIYKVSNKLYVFDYLSHDLLGPILEKKGWFFEGFANDEFINSFNKALAFLNLKIDILFSQNVFSAGFAAKYASPTVFDGWDNFLLFPENKSIAGKLTNAYQTFADCADVWVTNSLKNIAYYEQHFNLKECILIKNGADFEKFKKKYEVPNDLKQIKGPIIGFGGKITHLFNYEYFNYCVENNRDKSFVILGQILDKNVFKQIKIGKNVHYLGDKHYKEYPAYVTNFNVGIIPYVNDHLEHGADTIKVYEYLAAGLGVVGTQGAGMNELSDFIYVANSKEEFSSLIAKALVNKKEVDLPKEYTWEYKTNSLLDIFNGLIISNAKIT